LIIFLVSCNPKATFHKENLEKNTYTDTEIIDSEEAEIEMLERIKSKEIIVGSERLSLYLDSLRGKKVAIVANQTSLVGKTHLVDTLLSLGITIQKVFSPEHGFRGDADAGEKVSSDIDLNTGIPIISLYGNNKKPKHGQLKDVDIVLFDIQDVGVRFYTYISTLHYVMESCAELDIPVIVLDRPNPNGHYIDGPILQKEHKSFVGMHPVPVVYGMTIGEYALMINQECWLNDSIHCDLSVVPLKNYTHKSKYKLPVPPSPNLRSEMAITLYPSLCFFEATSVSVGRGTERPFEQFGHPLFPSLNHTFTPISSYGAKKPLWENQQCNAIDAAKQTGNKRMFDLNIQYLLDAKKMLGDSIPFINQPSFFDRLAGTSELRKQINEGLSAKEIRHSWRPGIKEFRKIRMKYLLYE
jgi:uncharacterized protein YbbC (DUF1343 family)